MQTAPSPRRGQPMRPGPVTDALHRMNLEVQQLAAALGLHRDTLWDYNRKGARRLFWLAVAAVEHGLDLPPEAPAELRGAAEDNRRRAA